MFTCPDKDIHSVYLDNELPVSYIEKYEIHVESCEKCKKELEKIKKIRDLFKKSTENICLSDEQKNKSFERLQARLSYNNAIRISEKNKRVYFDFIKYASPIVAAAVTVFAVTIPLRVRKNVINTNHEGAITPIITKQITSPISENSVLMNGNITHLTLSRVFNVQNNTKLDSDDLSRNDYARTKLDSDSLSRNNLVRNNFANFDEYDEYFEYLLERSRQVDTNKKNKVQHVRVKRISDALAAIDVFRPEFDESNTIQIRITIPTVENIPVYSNEKSNKYIQMQTTTPIKSHYVKIK